MLQPITEYEIIATKVALASAIKVPARRKVSPVDDWLVIVSKLITRMRWPLDKIEIVASDITSSAQTDSTTAIVVKICFKCGPCAIVTHIGVKGPRDKATVYLRLDREDVPEPPPIDLASPDLTTLDNIVDNMRNKIHDRIVEEAWNVARSAA